jgi:hypothetical protein
MTDDSTYHQRNIITNLTNINGTQFIIKSIRESSKGGGHEKFSGKRHKIEQSRQRLYDQRAIYSQNTG